VSDPVFLWQATSPGSEASGMSGDRGRALEEAAECLLSGQATEALVEEAVVQLTSLAAGGGRQSYYTRTGEAWHAEAGGQDVRWVPVQAEAGAR
jgi:hypothetical protein